MRARCRTPTLALAALATALSGAASAAGGRCDAPALDADAALAARLPDLMNRLRAELSSSSSIDACARITLRAVDPGAIEVVVTLLDGRSATRTAAEPEDVLPALQALLLVPVPSPELAAEVPRKAPPRPSQRVRLPPRRSEPSELSERGGTLAAVTPRRLGVELSLLGGARLGDGQLSAGLGALSLLEKHGWLFGFSGRMDRYEALRHGDPELALELGVLAGKRFHFPSVALDIVAGPAVAVKNLATSNSEVVHVERGMPQSPTPSPSPSTEPSTGPVPRFLVGAHVGFSPRSVLRGFVGMEASAGPANSDDSPSQGRSRFPLFALGVVFGGTVGTR